jgi:MoaA/NifB/PqqE/SkfB family radical SAM enzyme
MVPSLPNHLSEREGPSVVSGADLPLHAILAALDARMAPARSVENVVTTLEESKEQLYESLARTQSPLVAKSLTIKILNLFLSKYHFLRRSTTLHSSPYGIIVDPMNACQLACTGCIHSARSKELKLFDWGPGVLSESMFADLMRRYGPYAIETSFFNFGEPLLNPDTPKLIRLAKTYLTRTALSTNMAVKHFDAEAYVNSGLDYMTLSIDGATQDTYEKFRRKGDIEIVFQNVRSLMETRARMGKRTPVVSWQYLAFEHNEHEIDDAIMMAQQLKVDLFIVAAPYDVSVDDPNIRPSEHERRVILFQSDFGEVVVKNWNPFPADIAAEPIEREFAANWLERLVGERPSGSDEPLVSAGHTCHYLYKNMVMDARGRIMPCCSAPQTGKPNFVYGNAQSATDVFNSEEYRLARLSFVNPEQYQIEVASPGLSKDVYCAKCTWNQDRAQVNAENVRNYFAAVGNNVFNPDSIGILGSW